MHPKNQFYTGNSISGRREAFGQVPSRETVRKRDKKNHNAGFGPLGQFYTSVFEARMGFSRVIKSAAWVSAPSIREVMIKSAASAASPKGLSSRDPVSRQRGLPKGQKIVKKAFKK